MPNRILKDSICTSPNIDALGREAEVFFYRLLVQCDDYGRMDARPAILRAKCYPLQIDKVSQDDVKRWLGELVRANLVIPYNIDGADYLQMRTWEKHQQVRAKRSKYPDMISSDINCNQVQSDAPVIQSNPIQSETNVVVVDEQRGKVVELFKNNMPGSMTPIIADQLNDLIDTYGTGEVAFAIKAACESNARNLRYITGVLANRAAGGDKPQRKERANGDNRSRNNGSSNGYVSEAEASYQLPEQYR